MKLLLIQPKTHGTMLGQVSSSGKAGKVRLSLPAVAAVTPDDVDIRIVDTRVQEIDYDEPVDLVGISVLTPEAPKAYEIAARFRGRGVKVVLGGYHPTLMPEEAAENCDAVVVGEAEPVWADLISDFTRGELKPRYPKTGVARVPRGEDIPAPKMGLLNPSLYHDFNAVQATRNCPYDCDYCSIHAFHGDSRFVTRPVEAVVEEINDLVAATKERDVLVRLGLLRPHITFVDDNLTANRKYALALFDAIAPLKITWDSQVTTEMGRDQELLAAAKRSGCKWVSIGFETSSAESRAYLRKNVKRPKASEAPEKAGGLPATAETSLEQTDTPSPGGDTASDNSEGVGEEQDKSLDETFRQAVENLHAHRINVLGNFVFGFPWDDIEVFDEIMELTRHIRVDAALFHVLTPYPGTKLRDELEGEMRIVTDAWQHYHGGSVVFVPDKMAPETLQRGFTYAFARFYRLRDSVWRAFSRPWGIVDRVMMNGSMRRKCKQMHNMPFAEEDSPARGMPRWQRAWVAINVIFNDRWWYKRLMTSDFPANAKVWPEDLRKAWYEYWRQQRWLAKVVEEMPEQVSVIDRDYNILYLNKVKKEENREALKYSSRKCYTVFEGRDEPCEGCPTMKSMDGVKIFQYPWVPHKEGEPCGFLVEISAAPLDRGAHGKATTAVEVSRLITETVRIRDLFKRLLGCVTDEDVIQAALETFLALGYPRARHYRYDEENGGALRMADALPKGQELEEVIKGGKVSFEKGGHSRNPWYAVEKGRSVIMVFLESGEDKEPEEDDNRLCLVAHTKHDKYRKLLGKEGSPEWIDVPLTDGCGGFLGKFSIDCQDESGFSGWKDAYYCEMVCTLAYHALVGLSAKEDRRTYLDRLTAELSHTLKSKAGLLKLNLELLNATSLSDEQTEIAHRLHRATEFLRKSAILSGQMAATVQREKMACIDIAKPVRDAVELFADSRLQAELPGEPVFVWGDADLVQEAVVQLLENAVDFVHHESGTVTVSVTPREKEVLIEVIDDGDGIHPNMRDELFEPFAHYPGHRFGMGLAVVKKIVNAHGGSIEETGRLGQGARFEIKLPLARGRDHAK